MRDSGNQKSKGKKPDSTETNSATGAVAGVGSSKPAPMTAKEKIAANQRNKRRK
ncbi:MAG: hypothetical protein ACP5NN_06935 [Methanolinea sp.]|jgi:ABC-type phosphate transport system substrate-binding protein